MLSSCFWSQLSSLIVFKVNIKPKLTLLTFLTNGSGLSAIITANLFNRKIHSLFLIKKTYTFFGVVTQLVRVGRNLKYNIKQIQNKDDLHYFVLNIRFYLEIHHVINVKCIAKFHLLASWHRYICKITILRKFVG